MFYRYRCFAFTTRGRLRQCLYDCPGYISLFARMSKCFIVKTHQCLDFVFLIFDYVEGVLGSPQRPIDCTIQASPNGDSWSFTDFRPLSVSNSRKMFCNWFQTLIILWKAALKHRLSSLKARVKYVAVIKNNRTTRALPTYQSFVVKVRNTHVEMVHHFNRASKLLMAMQLILVLFQAPFFHCSFSLTAEICGKVATAF